MRRVALGVTAARACSSTTGSSAWSSAATCGTLLVHALLNVPEALMQRAFNFKRKLIVDP